MKTEILVALLAGGLAGFGASLLVAPSPVAEPSAPARVHIDLDPLLMELRALRRQLELPTVKGPGSGASDPGRDATPLNTTGSSPLTAADLTVFLDALSDRLAASLQEPTDVSGLVRSGYGRPHDRQAVQTLRATLTDDNEYSPPSVFALTPRQVYTRYGTPTQTWLGQHGTLRWVYMAEDEETMTVLQFVNGYVINAWLE
jgi:hypothetical protein